MPARDSSGRFVGGGGGGKGIFDFDSLTPGLQALLPKVDAAVALAFKVMESRAESKMRNQAPWTDRTGNARQGLMATAGGVPMVVRTLVLYHTMPYGLWLEVRFSGKYAVIGPVMFEVAPELAAYVAAAVNRAVR